MMAKKIKKAVQLICWACPNASKKTLVGMNARLGGGGSVWIEWSPMEFISYAPSFCNMRWGKVFWFHFGRNGVFSQYAYLRCKMPSKTRPSVWACSWRPSLKACHVKHQIRQIVKPVWTWRQNAYPNHPLTKTESWCFQVLVDIVCNLPPATAGTSAPDEMKIVPCNLSDLAEFAPWLAVLRSSNYRKWPLSFAQSSLEIESQDLALHFLESWHLPRECFNFSLRYPIVARSIDGWLKNGPGADCEESLHFQDLHLEITVTWRQPAAKRMPKIVMIGFQSSACHKCIRSLKNIRFVSMILLWYYYI